jgi:hypothetical protein
MANATNITYGSYNFQNDAGPVPQLTINKDFRKLGDGRVIGSLYRATLQGEFNKVPSGIVGIKNLNDMKDLLDSAFSTGCLNFKLTCDANVLISQYPRINSLSFSPTNDNWTQSIDYTVELEWDGETLSGWPLESISESWDFQIDEQSSIYDWDYNGTGDNNMHLFGLTHTLSAKGLSCGSYTGTPGWHHARDFVVTQLGYNSSHITNSGVFNLNSASFSGYNHSRVQKIDESDGHFHVTENWIIADPTFGSNAGKAIEDFTVTIGYDLQNGLTNTSINGSIQGLQEVSYGTNPNDYTVNVTKYENASGFWELTRPKLSNRASLVSNTSVNPVALNYSIGHNPTKGAINYTYTFDNRPCNFISGSLSESIVINDNNPSDTFAQIAILGRPWGPVLQNLNSPTASTRNVNISVNMGPLAGCSDIVAAINGKPDVTALLCTLQNDLSGANTQMFKSSDSESWDARMGIYSRNVVWTWVLCSGSAPNTSFC